MTMCPHTPTATGAILPGDDTDAASTPSWRKSGRCTPDQQCVEVAPITGRIAVRDSTDPEGPRLMMRAGAWREFVGEVKTGQFDLA
jgi:hypothetical protein